MEEKALYNFNEWEGVGGGSFEVTWDQARSGNRLSVQCDLLLLLLRMRGVHGNDFGWRAEGFGGLGDHVHPEARWEPERRGTVWTTG